MSVGSYSNGAYYGNGYHGTIGSGCSEGKQWSDLTAEEKASWEEADCLRYARWMKKCQSEDGVPNLLMKENGEKDGQIDQPASGSICSTD